jgi:signal transduction histidine kinase/CheY-like chemotaxis protein
MRWLSPSGRPTGRFWRWLMPFLLMLCASSAWPQTTLEIRQAWFSRDASHPEKPVRLPDTWKQRGLPADGFGRYRIPFEMREAPPDGQAWALRAERLSRFHRIWLNGVLVHAPEDTPELRIHASAVLTWLEMPANSLRQGSNELVVEVYHRRRGGLSAIWIGPAASLQPTHQWALMRQATLPQWVNMLAAGFSLLLLLLWLERRQEHALGLFSLLSLLTSVRNSVYGLTVPYGLVWALDLFYYLCQVMSVLLLSWFALAWSERRLPHYRMLLHIAAPLLLLGGSMAAWLGRLEPWRTWAYPLLMLMALPALWLILAHAHRVGGWRRGALASALLIMMGAAVHDYLVGQGRLPVTSSFIMPWAQPLAMIAFASLLAERLVVALRSSERYQVELERVVAQRTAELQASDLAKTRLLDAASHDLRQPVTAIGLQLGMARSRTTEPGQRQLLDRAMQGLQSLESLLKGLLDYSRLSRTEALAAPGPVRVQGLFDSICLHAEPLARARGLQLRVRPSTAWVLSDPLLLEQILRNLLSNAIQHTDSGGVLLALRRRGTTAWLEVRDTGPGIAAADQQRIFEPFVQLQNPARARERGTGLGLAIVQEAARKLGHVITLQSQPGRGSCFRLQVPLIEAPISPGVSAATPDTAPPLPALPAMQVWLVEDDASLREALAEQLQGWGLRVQAFADAESVLKPLAHTTLPPPDWVLSDLRLPGLDGAGMLSALLDRWPQLRAVLMSAERQPPTGRWIILHKPFSPAELWQQLHQTPAPEHPNAS